MELRVRPGPEPYQGLSPAEQEALIAEGRELEPLFA
jgi:hypothetical protein